jgi:hypothetical protein
MRDLNHDLKQLCQRNRDGSYATRANRERILTLVANQLHALGFRHMRADSLKPKHVERLVERWNAEGLSAGTIKNRLAEIRWWAEKVDRANVVARSNDAYRIERRVYVTNVSKAKVLDVERLEKMTDPYSVVSVKLTRAFGFRRETSIKIQPAWADRGEYLQLKASWTKGGKEYGLPIRTAYQREVLEEAKRLAATTREGSLIQKASYKEQLERFVYQCKKAAIDHVHAYRHCYAQERYRELTGWEAPARGGPTSKQLTPEQKVIDREARLTISRELGHEREQVTAIYLAR